MKPILEHIPSAKQQSVFLKNIEQQVFDTPYHYHPEVELTFIEQGRGTRHVGVHMEEFEAGDLVLVGGGLPHCWLGKSAENDRMVKAYVIQFQKHIIVDPLAKLPELKSLKDMLNGAGRGIKFNGQDYYGSLKRLFSQEGSTQILGLLALLNELSYAPKKFLLDVGYVPSEGNERYHKVFGFIISNFRRSISLKQAAEVAGLSESSFCRYFKKTTGQTLFEVLLSYRLSHASQLLLSTQKPISEIAFESGFQDIPYFNRVFKKMKGQSPRLYQKSKQKL